MADAAEKNREFLDGISAWFQRVRARYGHRMRCGRGCSLCCYGLFDVSLPDAFLAAGAFAALPPDIRSAVIERAQAIQARILEAAPDLKLPYLLNGLPEEKIDAIVEHAQSPPCIFLGANAECLIYAHRPLACRLEGVPMVDVEDGLFGDWCELNFVDGVPEEIRQELALDYGELGHREGPGRIFLASIVLACSQLSAFDPSGTLGGLHAEC